jgi:cysteine desulfurase
MYGKDSPRISESIRISFGRYNKTEDLDKLVDAITKIVNRVKNKGVKM